MTAPRLYAIGDIHGQLARLQAAHRLVAADGGAEARIVHLGDLIDRGPDSRGVIDYLRGGQARGRDWVVLMGNHDRFVARLFDDPDWIDGNLSRQLHWVEHPAIGAGATLASYGIDPALPPAQLREAALRCIPRDHADWLAGLPRWHLAGKALFVHAGVRPGVDLWNQHEDDLVWIRREFLDSRADHGPLVVHGHTPVKQVTHYGNRLNVDTGAGHGGPLSAVVIEGRNAHLLTEQGRVPVATGGSP